MLKRQPSSRNVRMILAAVAFVAAPMWCGSGEVLAQQPAAIYAPGEPIVTGFSGVLAPNPPPTTGDPMDKTFIDPDGSSMVVQQLQPSGPPAGQLIPSPVAFAARARDVGQVFGIALDDAAVPNIYLSATSAFGLDIITLGSDGQPTRSKLGAPGAAFMPGQWGPGGGPGSIWKVDGATGAISLFSTIAADTGAGLGDIAFDPATRQLFASDLDTGLVYRIGLDGTIADSFDHGVTGRPAHGLAAIADDGSEMAVTNPAFNSEDPQTWGFTQAERKVYGLAMHDGRLYYAVAAGPSIWSIGINPDGSFGEPRWELDVTGLPSAGEITNIVFDNQGRMILAERGPQGGSYDYSIFADSKASSVVRYTHEFPGDPATPSAWVATPDSYAIGFRPDGNNADGGIALGYGYDPQSQTVGGACDAYLWSTGDALRDDHAASPTLESPAQVHGLQGNDENLVRPENDPPSVSYFADYDGNTGDDQAQNQGHVGDVEIWQNCKGSQAAVPAGSGLAGGTLVGANPPGYLPPPGYVPPKSFDLSLSKWASPQYCADDGSNWDCKFVIRVENAGTTPYWGPLTVSDWLPANPAGATMTFHPTTMWTCLATGSTQYQCDSVAPQLLFPGDSRELYEDVELPKNSVQQCLLTNNAQILWPFAHDDNPADDFASANALIDDQQCQHPPGNTSQLTLTKTGTKKCDADLNHPDIYECGYVLTVTNTGPGDFSGPLTVTDTLPTGTTNVAFTNTPLTCSLAGNTATCSLPAPAVDAPVGTSWAVTIFGDIPAADANGKPICSVNNVADITVPTSGAHAEFPSTIDNPKCQSTPGNPNITVAKTLEGCAPLTYQGVAGFACYWDYVFNNAGNATYSGPLAYTDTSANATVSELQGGCPGQASNFVCNFPSVSLPPGPTGLSGLATFYPPSPTLCSVDNTITLTTPAPGNAATAHADLTGINPACSKSPSSGELTLTKTAAECSSGLLEAVPGTFYACYTIIIQNTGPTEYKGPVKFTDQFAVPVDGISVEGADCSASAGGYECSADADLQPHQSVTYKTYGTFNSAPPSCAVTNTATLTSPNTGLQSAATTQVISHDCAQKQLAPTGPHPKPPYANVTIEKYLPSYLHCTYQTASDTYSCPFQIVVGNTGTGPTPGPVRFKDLPGIPGATLALGAPGFCNVDICQTPNSLMPGQTWLFSATMTAPREQVMLDHCRVPNSATVINPPNGPTANAIAIIPSRDPICKLPRPSGNGAPTPSATTTSKTPPLHLVPGVVPQCSPHSSGKYPNCACDRGYHKGRDGKTCVQDTTPTPAPKTPIRPILGPQCGPHSFGKYPACSCFRGFHHPAGSLACVANPVFNPPIFHPGPALGPRPPIFRPGLIFPPAGGAAQGRGLR